MADPLLAVHFQTVHEQKLHLEISLESEIRYEKIKNCEDTVLLSGRAPSYVAPPYYDCPEPVVYEDGKGIRFTLAVKVVVPQGSVKCCDGKLLIEGEQDIFVLFYRKYRFWTECRYTTAGKRVYGSIGRSGL